MVWLSCEIVSPQIEEVVLSLPLVSLVWEVKVTEVEQDPLQPEKGAKDDWLCIPCGAECVVEVMLDRSSLKNVSSFGGKPCLSDVFVPLPS